MATLNATDQEIYKDIRAFLLGLFPEAGSQIVQINVGVQANNPLPRDAIVMQVLFDRNFDTAVVTPVVADNEAIIQNSVEVRLQLDFYGAPAQQRGRTVETLWRTYYACERLQVCQPLYVQSYNRHPYVNDSNLLEDRWILDLALQYNPQVTVAQDFADTASAPTTIPVPSE